VAEWTNVAVQIWPRERRHLSLLGNCQEKETHLSPTTELAESEAESYWKPNKKSWSHENKITYDVSGLSLSVQ